jgi:hypothetical protein
MAALQMPTETLFGVGIQQGTPGAASDYLKTAAGYEQVVSINDNFSWYALTDVGMSPVKTQVPLPQEIGGRALTSGTYVTGTWAAGPITVIPRLDDRIGWLLLGALGDVSSVVDTEIDNLSIFGGVHGADAGVNSHIFRFQSSDQHFIPWLTVRKRLPHSTAASRLGETFQDCRIGALTGTIASGTPLTMDMDFVGRLKQSNYIFDFNPSWGDQTYDDYDNFAVPSCAGHFQVGGTSFSVTNMTFTVANNVLPPAQSVVIGTTHPVDFPVLSRTFTVTATFLVDTWDLYVSTFAGSSVSATDSNVSCTIYNADLSVLVASQNFVTGVHRYEMRVVSNQDTDNAAWTVAPVRIIPDRPIVVTATCSVQALSSGYPIMIILQNDKASYALPSPV